MQDEEQPAKEIPVPEPVDVPVPEMRPMPEDGLAAAEALRALRQGKPLQGDEEPTK